MKFEELCDSIKREVKDKRVVVVVGCAGTGINTIAEHLIKGYLEDNGGIVNTYHSNDSFYHEKITVDSVKAIAYKGVVLHNNFEEVTDEFKSCTLSEKVFLSVQLPVHGHVRLEILEYLVSIFNRVTLIDVDRRNDEYKYEELEVVL